VRLRRGFLTHGVEIALAVALIAAGGAGAWQLNRPLPNAAALVVGSIPEGALVIDARGSLAYRRGHLPGAHQLWSRDLLSFTADVPGSLAEPADIAERFSALGLAPGQPVVVYDDGGAQDAPLVVLVLHAFGIDARLLEGGVAAWLAAGGELGDEPPPPPARHDTDRAFDRRLLVDAEETLEHLAENLIAPLDLRDPESYRAQHLDGAVSMPADALFGPEGLPRWSDLANRLAAARITMDTHPLVYGADLHQAARGWLALSAYGLPHIHVFAGPFDALVAAGAPVTDTPSDRATSVPSSSVCWR
jgi:3-mercaptopyruvate sulfurtransferase SseA